MYVSITEDCSTIQLMKRETIFYAYQYERKVSKDFFAERRL